jgi:O-glycosyl hydrolase
MYTSSFFVLATSLVSFSACQSIGHLGSLGGNGPSGGIGDKAHPGRHAQSFVTDALYPEQPNTTRQLAEGEAPKLVKKSSPVCPETRHVIVDSSPEGAQQEMVGFGHSWTDSTVSTFNSLEPDVFDRLMHDLFGQDGNNMGFMRHTIGSSDLSGVQYSYDDNGPHFNQGEPDEEHLPNFDIGVHGRAMADMIAKAGEYKSDIFLFGSPWSYPGWTKNNGLFVAPNLLNGYNLLNNSFDINYIPHMVNYFTKYVDAFKERGVTVNGVTLMNEPLNCESC